MGFEVVADEPDPVAAVYDGGGSDGVGILADLSCMHLQCTCFESMWRKQWVRRIKWRPYSTKLVDG